MPDLSTTVSQFTARYRTALIAQVAVWGGLVLALVAVLAWRLRAVAPHAAWSLGAPLVLALAGAAGGAWWLRRYWISPHSAASHLDRTFELQQRLVTAEEFAHAERQPALYPELLDDTARRLSSGQARLPRPVNRLAVVLALLVLLLLLWPMRGRSPLQLALGPRPQTPPASSPHATPPEPPRQEGAQETGAAPQPSDRSKGQGPQDARRQPSDAEAEGDGSKPRDGDRGGTQETAGGPEGRPSQSERTPGDAQPQDGAQAGSGDQAEPRPGNGAETSMEGQERADQDAGGMTPELADARRPEGSPPAQPADRGTGEEQVSEAARQEQAGRDDRAKASAAKGEGTDQEGMSDARRLASQAAKEAQRAGRDDGSMAAQAAAGGTRDQRAQGAASGGASGEGREALKADIQELLRELSDELKLLHGQLGTREAPHPLPGTSTDPELYGGPMEPEPEPGAVVPIQLQTDRAPTASERPGGGVGEPSEEVSDTGPQMIPEAARLSQRPLDETPVSRQPIPPEYRSVFDRLSERRTQPSEATP